ncbi:hypothetical protein [Candidatus Allofournierella excrementavium]|uniref:hypothetical protein n=1 Tax=Candidatus Allofournierella excrementavium TaxID=2838591 RepID=UPI003AF1D5DE
MGAVIDYLLFVGSRLLRGRFWRKKAANLVKTPSNPFPPIKTGPQVDCTAFAMINISCCAFRGALSFFRPGTAAAAALPQNAEGGETAVYSYITAFFCKGRF